MEGKETKTHGVVNLFKNLNYVMCTDARDWSINRADAWLYGIIIGWENDDPLEGEKEDDALDEICEKHGFDKDILKGYRSSYLKMK